MECYESITQRRPVHPDGWEMEYCSILDLQELPHIIPSIAVVLDRRQFCPLGDIWQYLETFLVVRVVGGRGATSIWWVKSTGGAKHLTMLRTVLATKHYLVQMSAVLSLRNSALQCSTFYQIRIRQNSGQVQDDSKHFW